MRATRFDWFSLEGETDIASVMRSQIATLQQTTIPIVVVNWNEGRLLGESCLQSLANMNESCEDSGIVAKVLVIDNGSSDTSFRVINEFVRRNYSNVRFECVWKAGNLGFVRSTNLGIKLGLVDPSVRFVATLNPDTKVHPDWLVNLFECARKECEKEKVGMFASGINVLKVTDDTIEETEEPYNFGHSYHQDGACLDICKPDLAGEKMFCHCHAGALLNRKMLEQCGLIDEDYFGWYDCPSQGWKARLGGWKPILVKDARMWHRKSGRRRGARIRKIVERNRVLTILRFMPIDKQSLAIGEYLTQPRRDGTTYEEKKLAIEEAMKLFGELGQYPAELSQRYDVYNRYCFPRHD